MTTNPPIDYRQYVLSLRISGPLAAGLAQKLVNAAPEDLDTNERALLARIAETARVVDDIRTERERFSPAKVRPFVALVSAAWGPLHDALYAASRVDPRLGDRGPRAQRVFTSLFADGMTFVTLEGDAVWSEAMRRLRRVDDEEMRTEIDALVGPEHLQAARTSADALGDALGNGTHKRRIPSTTALQRALAAFSRAIASYCRMLSAKVDEEDETTVERFQHAVAPIDDYRAAHPTVRGEEEIEDEGDPTDEEPESPAPPITPPG